jgi:hypothetical protein
VISLTIGSDYQVDLDRLETALVSSGCECRLERVHVEDGRSNQVATLHVRGSLAAIGRAFRKAMGDTAHPCLELSRSALECLGCLQAIAGSEPDVDAGHLRTRARQTVSANYETIISGGRS